VPALDAISHPGIDTILHRFYGQLARLVASQLNGSGVSVGRSNAVALLHDSTRACLPDAN
jgi:hypothetical protein